MANKNTLPEDDFLSNIDPLTTKRSEQKLKRGRRNKAVAARRRKRRFLTLLAVILIIAAAAYPVYNYVYLPYTIESVYAAAKNAYGRNSDTLPDNMLEKFGRLYEINPDIGGWVVAGTGVNYPVVDPKKNDVGFYTSHLFDGTFNGAGTPYFVDSYIPGGENKNIAVRGSSKIFGALTDYRSLEYYKINPLIAFDTVYEENTYKIFAVCEISLDDLLYFSRNSFKEGEFGDFIEKIASQSLLTTPVTLTGEDKVLSLFTELSNGRYFAVFSRAMYDNESPSVDVSLASINNDGYSDALFLDDESDSSADDFQSDSSLGGESEVMDSFPESDSSDSSTLNSSSQYSE